MYKTIEQIKSDSASAISERKLQLQEQIKEYASRSDIAGLTPLVAEINKLTDTDKAISGLIAAERTQLINDIIADFPEFADGGDVALGVRGLGGKGIIASYAINEEGKVLRVIKLMGIESKEAGATRTYSEGAKIGKARNNFRDTGMSEAKLMADYANDTEKASYNKESAKYAKYKLAQKVAERWHAEHKAS